MQLAEGGTLFLDEVDTLSLKAQVFLLRFLQDRVYRPVGSPVERVANVRIVAATNASLASIATGGAFRSDLLFRLRVLHVRLPPLRERREDLPELARHFLTQCATRLLRAPKRLHPEVLQRMLEYAWPGNLRELENMICRAFLLEDGPELRLDAFSDLDDAEGSGPVVDPRVCGYSEAKAAAICAFEVRSSRRSWIVPAATSPPPPSSPAPSVAISVDCSRSTGSTRPASRRLGTSPLD